MHAVMGAVLAGGRSERMGSDKAMFQLRAGTMSELVAAAMLAELDHVVVIGRERPVAGLDAVPDGGTAHRGPLSGLVAALEFARRPIVLVGVDQPLLRRETIRQLATLAAQGSTALCHDEVPQVTCAAYQPSVLEAARHHLDGGGSIQSMLSETPHTAIPEDEWRQWGEDGRSWCSLDSRSDIVEAERRFRINLLD